MNLYEKLRKKYYRHAYEAANLSKLITQPQPSNSDFEVCFYAPPPQYFNRGGKVTAFEYLPEFCDQIRARGIATHLISRRPDLAEFVDKDATTVIVCIYQEEDGHIPTDRVVLDMLDKADHIFNCPRQALKILNKLETSKALSANGCNVPKLADELSADAQVFSNVMEGTAEASYLTKAADATDEARFNAQFIDTRMPYEGRQYHTTMRLMSINDTITHTFIRARDAAEDNPNTHAKDTPQDAKLVETLWKAQMRKYEDQFEKIAKQVFETFGDGFYAHDTLIDHASETVFVCETGWKFNDMAYRRRVTGFEHKLEGLRGHTDPTMSAKSAAPIFLDCVRESLSRK